MRSVLANRDDTTFIKKGNILANRARHLFTIKGWAIPNDTLKYKLSCTWSYGCPPELLKVEVVKSHECAKFSRICAKLRLLRAKLVNQALFL